MIRSAFLLFVSLTFCTSCDNTKISEADVHGGPKGAIPDANLKRIVRPGQITVRLDSNDPVGENWLVSGEFIYAKSRPGEPGIQSEGHGGACLVTETDKSCDSNNPCAPQFDASTGSYCLYDGPTQEGAIAQQGKCWVRPLAADKKYCTRAIPPDRLTLGTHKVPRVEEGGFARMPARPSRVRMITCLNPPMSEWPEVTDSDGNTEKVAPCRLPDGAKLERVGKPVELRMPE